MTDREKVLKGLESCAKSDTEDWCFHMCELCPYDLTLGCKHILAAAALELLKEQEPKLVKITKNAYNYKFYYCPNCGRSFEYTYYERPLFCDKCGQAVKWDG